tara:strand:- start:632 stop:910 length:279 start_codon:yes stop_codon:yes gene_type:complete
MATFKQRLYNDVPVDDDDSNISAHAFEAAHVLFISGDITEGQIKTAFTMSQGDWDAVQAVIGTAGIDVVNATVIAKQEGYITAGAADTILGI